MGDSQAGPRRLKSQERPHAPLPMTTIALRISADEAARVRQAMRPALVADNGPRFARVFYALLFDVAPHLRRDFPPDIVGLQQKLLLTLSVILRNLDDPAGLSAEVARLRAVHPKYETHTQLMQVFIRCFRKAYAIVVGAEFPAAEWAVLHRALLYLGLLVTAPDEPVLVG